MANDYKPLNNAATNLEELLMVQNSDGIYASKYNGKEPFEVLAAKTIFNNYADVQAAIAADVEGPASATDNALARFDGTTGKLIQNSNAILTDAGALTLATSLIVNGTTDSSSKDTGAIITEGGLGVEKSATIGGNLTVSGLATVSTTGNNKQIGSFYSTDLSNGSAADLVLGKAFSANDCAFIRYRKEATTSTLSLFHYGDSGDTFKISKGEGVSMTGNLTVSGTAINLSTNNSTDKVVSIGYSTVPLYLTSSYDGSTFGLSGFSANSRPSGSSYTTPSNTSYGNLYFLAKIAASDTASAFEWKHAPRTAGTPVTTSLMTLNGSGNLLLGTTTDTGQKLQVKGGTRITDSASASNYITIGSGNDAPYGNNSVVAQTGTLVMGTVAAASLALYTNATTALTLDSSQNATFAGKLTSTDAGYTNSGYEITNTTASRTTGWFLTNSATTVLRDVTGAADLLSVDTSGNATFAGNIKTAAPSGGTAATWRLGTVASVSPTSPNRTIEVEIGGTTYYIAAKTTNN